MEKFNKLIEETLNEVNWSKGEMNAMSKGMVKRKNFCPKCGMISFVYPGKYKKACSACGFVAEPKENPIEDGDIRNDVVGIDGDLSKKEVVK